MSFGPLFSARCPTSTIVLDILPSHKGVLEMVPRPVFPRPLSIASCLILDCLPLVELVTAHR